MNYVKISGRIVREPEFKFTASGVGLLQMTVVVDSTPRWDRDKDAHVSKPNFVSVQFWGSMAEKLAEDGVGKGMEVMIEGEIDQSEYENRDGRKESKTRVRGWTLTLLTPTVESVGGRDDLVASEEPPF